MTGLEQLEAIARGDIPEPPIGKLLGFELVRLAHGSAIFAVEPRHEHYNPIGVVHAGLAMTLVDSAAACAVHSTLAEGEAYTTLETKVNFVRAITVETGRIFCEGKIVHRGGRTATAEAKVISERDGKLLAHGTSTCLIMRADEAPRTGNGNGRR